MPLMRSRSLTAAAAALFALSCAGSSGSSSGTRGDGGVADGAGGSALPDPGKAPTSTVGLIGVSHVARADGARDVTVSAAFVSPPRDLTTSEAAAAFSGYAGIALDTCADPSNGVHVGTSDQPSLESGGKLTITSPAAVSAEIAPLVLGAGMTIYSATYPDAAWVPLGEWTLAGDGTGIVSAFSGKFHSPGVLSLVTPALPISGMPTIPRDRPFDVAWKPVNDGLPVLIHLSQGDTTITCRVADDGAFAVPASILGGLAATSSGASQSPDHVSIVKSVWYAIPPGGASPATAVVTVEDGASFDVAFE